MQRTTRQKVAAALAGATMVGGLAGCSMQAADAGGADTSAKNTENSQSSDSSTTASYADGEYTETGTYTPPSNHEETITVTVTLKDGVVTELEVEGTGGSPNSVTYQGKFIDGINALVVGKNIDELDISKVAGSSLTSQGFNAAIEKIKADAAE